MKLINKTNWDTRDLRKILLECIRVDGCRTDLNIEVATLRRDANDIVRGKARYHSPNVWICIKDPSGKHIPVSRLRVRFAQVALHEIAHTRGDRHSDMILYQDIEVPWVHAFDLKPKSENNKPKRDLREARYQRVLAGIKRNETRLKRTKTILKKLYRKKRYYERTGINGGGE